MREFNIAFGLKTFDEIITAGSITVEAINIRDARSQAFLIVTQYLRDEEEEDEPWTDNVQRLTISVTESEESSNTSPEAN